MKDKKKLFTIPASSIKRFSYFLFFTFVFAHRWLATLGWLMLASPPPPERIPLNAHHFGCVLTQHCQEWPLYKVVHCEQMNKRSLCRVHALCLVHISVSIAFIWLRHIIRMYRERGMNRHGMEKEKTPRIAGPARPNLLLFDIMAKRFGARLIRHSATN